MTDNSDLSPLFRPLKIGSHIVPSRLFLAPVNTGYAESGRTSKLLVDFHKDRSGPAVGINMIGNVAVSADGASNEGTLLLESDAAAQDLRFLAETISALGSTPGIQLAFSPPGLMPTRNWVARDPKGEQERLRSLISSIPNARVANILEMFLRSIAHGARAGFKVLQIHAAHGYFLSLLTNPIVNLRTGEYSADSRWFEDFIARALNVAGDAILSVRFSLFSGLLADQRPEVEFISQLSARCAKLGVPLLDYSAGFYSVDKRLIYPGLERGPMPYLDLLRPIAKLVDCIVSLGGNICDTRNIPDLEGNMAVSVGRALIADPDFAAKSRLRAYGSIQACTRRARCHYFSRGRRGLQCGVNTALGTIRA